MKSGMDILALLPMEFLAQQPDPFENMSDSDNRLDENYRDVVSWGILGYQLFTYFRLLEQYLDEASARRIRNLMLSSIGHEQGLGRNLQRVLALLDTACAIGPVQLEEEAAADDFPVEFSMALTLLLSLDQSPHFATDAKQREVEIRRMDINLDRKFSLYLKKAKRLFSERFVPILSRLFVDNKPNIN